MKVKPSRTSRNYIETPWSFNSLKPEVWSSVYAQWTYVHNICPIHSIWISLCEQDYAIYSHFVNKTKNKNTQILFIYLLFY